jgi:hypothetical protein
MYVLYIVISSQNEKKGSAEKGLAQGCRTQNDFSLALLEAAWYFSEGGHASLESTSSLFRQWLQFMERKEFFAFLVVGSADWMPCLPSQLPLSASIGGR